MSSAVSEIRNLLALSSIDGVGHALARNLISYCGSAEAVLRASYSELLEVPGIGSYTASGITKFRNYAPIDEEIELQIKNGVEIVTYNDAKYPTRLRHCEDAPLYLFMKGEVDLNKERIISVVGTRRSTAYGKQFTEELIDQLRTYDVTVVSGLASGTDTNAHRACLKSGLTTVAVLGHGFSTVYPGANRALSESISKQGALISEFFFHIPGNRENFPRRNRIVAGLSDAVIVVESGIKGGSLITADLANGYNRDVYALPGKISDHWSLGCNKLIYKNQAALINSIPELISELGYDKHPLKVKKLNTDLFNELNYEESGLLKLLENGALGIDELYFRSGIEMSKLSFVLISLEFRGFLKVLPGKMYSLT